MQLLVLAALLRVAAGLLHHGEETGGRAGAGHGVRGQQAKALSGAAAVAAAQSLGNTSDALGGILDAVTDSFSKVHSELGNIDARCRAELSFATSQVQAQTVALTGLSESKLQTITTVSGLEAELAHLAKSEAQVKASYDATVARRAAEQQAHADWRNTSQRQQDTLSAVLTHLTQKRTEAVASGLRSASSGSPLDHIIGTFKTLLSTAAQADTEEGVEHTEQDAELVHLAGTYRDSLQRIDMQISEKKMQKGLAQASLGHAEEEAVLRRNGVDMEEKAAADMQLLCGGHGRVSSIAAAEAQAISGLTTQVEQLLLTMDGIINLEASSSGSGSGILLQGLLVQRQARAAQASPPAPVAGASDASPLSRAAKWLAEARASRLAGLTASSPLESGHVEQASKERPGRSAAEAAPRPPAGEAPPQSLPLRALVRVHHGSGGWLINATATPEECTREMQRLASELLVSRQAGRSARAEAATLAEQVAAAAARRGLALGLRGELAAAQAVLDGAWEPPVALQATGYASPGDVLTHEGAVTACTGQGSRLCEARELCPRGDLAAGPLGAAAVGEHWAPVNDNASAWIHIGSDSFGTCQIQYTVPTKLASKASIYCCMVGPPLPSIQGSEGLVAGLDDARRELDGLQANVAAYIEGGAPPAANDLPSALERLGKSVEAMRSQMLGHASALVGIYSGLKDKYTVALSFLQSEASSLEAQEAGLGRARAEAQRQAEAQENAQQQIVAEQVALQDRCKSTAA